MLFEWISNCEATLLAKKCFKTLPYHWSFKCFKTLPYRWNLSNTTSRARPEKDYHVFIKGSSQRNGIF